MAEMKDKEQTKEQLMQELQRLRQQVAELRESANRHRRAEAEIQGRLQDVTALSRVTTAIASAVDMTGALQNVCTELARFLRVPQSSFAILNPQCTTAEVIATYQPPDSPSVIGVVIPVTDNPSMAYILEHKAPLAITDAQTDPFLIPIHRLMRQWNIQSILIVPIIVDGKVIGTIEFDAFQRRVFSDSEVNLIQHVASQVGQVLIRKRAETEHERLLAALEHHSTQLQTAAEVSRAVSSILDPEALSPQVVDLVRERFNLYYAGLFLVDQTGEWTGEPGKWAVLRAGTGEAGRQMLAQGHKLEIGGTSMIGWCVANKQARIALDVGEEATRFENPLLPETHSELALPLISRGEAIGALTIQSSQEAAFSDEDIAVLQTMADQLANAVANARLYDQAQEEIADRRRAEEALAQEQHLLHTLMDNVPDHIYFKDTKSRFIRISKAHAKLFGLSDPAQAVGKTDFDFFTEEHAQPAYEDEQKVMQSGQPIVKEERETWPDGRETWVSTTKLPLYDEEGKIIGTFGISRDITERKRRTAQLQVGAEVAREAAAILDIHQLLDTTVHLVSEKFGFYHAGAFLVDEQSEYAVLRAASSEGGRRMLERGHRLPVGKVGIVGHVAATGEPRIALDVGQDAFFFNNPDLPDTRSEMGLPAGRPVHAGGCLLRGRRGGSTDAGRPIGCRYRERPSGGTHGGPTARTEPPPWRI